MPRLGSGLKYGQSVSINNLSLGIIFIKSVFFVFLKVIGPAKDIYNPAFNPVSIKSLFNTQQCIIPENLGAFYPFITSIVSIIASLE